MQAQQNPDPSYLIQGELLRHLHLVSSFRYPIQAHVNPEEALNSLLQAPRIVGEMTPMAWTYFNQPPSDGQLLLTWQPPRMRGAFATDGYIWADPEAQFHQEIKGYTLEICVHRAGYALGRDHQVATHTRFRYHIINKVPSVQGPAFDPQLWLVHYGPNEPQARIPIDRIQISPQIRQFVAERQYIEAQGGLQRKEFMLKDQANWPQLSLGQRQRMPQMPAHPAAAAPGYGMNPMQARPVSQQYYPPPTVQQPPAKRQRVNATQAHLSNAIVAGQIPDLIIEEEEGAALGDYLDNLTPSEISKMRYKQHHEWMEEIYSSVFSISQIVPEDLGLGLTGKLKELTDGIFNTPSYDAMKAPFEQEKYVQKYRNPGDTLQRTRQKKERLLDTPPGSFQYRKLSPEKLEEFETRISTFMDKGQEEIEAMKKAHAATVADFKKSKAYMVSERKLRDANNSTAEEIVKDLEASLKVSILEQKDVVCVQEGGLEKEDKSHVNGSGAASGNTNGSASNFNGNGMAFGAEDNSAAGLLDQFGSGSYEGTPVGRIPTPQISQPLSAAPTPGTTAGPSGDFIPQPEPDESGLDLIDGMDLDVDLGPLEDDVGGDLKPAGEDDWVLVNDSEQPAVDSNLQSDAKLISVSTPQLTDNSTPQAQPPAVDNSIEPPEASSANQIPDHTATPGSTTGMFHDADFGTFDNLDTAGDALADFDTGVGGDDDFGLDLGDDTMQFGDTPDPSGDKMEGDGV